MAPLLGFIPGIIKSGVDGFFRWKEGETKKEISLQDFELAKKKLAADIEFRFLEEMRKPDNDFRKFVLDYEGKAEDLHPAVQFMRASVRPFVTYWAIIILTFVMFGWVDGTTLQSNMAALPDKLWSILEMIFGFWFGGRALMQGIQTYKEGQVKVSREEMKARIEEAKANVQIAETKAANKAKVKDEDSGWFNW